MEIKAKMEDKLENMIHAFIEGYYNKMYNEQAWNNINEIADKLTKELELNFIFRIETWAADDRIDLVFEFLQEKKRSCRRYEGIGHIQGGYGVEALRMDKDFFLKYLRKLFFLGVYDFQFEDSKRIITITHDGDLKIIFK